MFEAVNFLIEIFLSCFLVLIQRQILLKLSTLFIDEVFYPIVQILSIVYVYDKISMAWLFAKLNAIILEVLQTCKL